MRTILALSLSLIFAGCAEPRPRRQQGRRVPRINYTPQPVPGGSGRRESQRPNTFRYDPRYPNGCPDGVCPLPQVKASDIPFAVWNSMAGPSAVSFADVPPGVAQKNWRDSQTNMGSCAFASLVTALRAAGQDELAEKVMRQGRHGAASIQTLIRTCDRAGIRFNFTAKGDYTLLQYANRTGKPAVIWWKPGHACLYLGERDGKVVIVDPNYPRKREYVPRSQFLSKWQSQYRVALLPVYSSPAPEPIA